jgi:hypothetical protein
LQGGKYQTLPYWVKKQCEDMMEFDKQQQEEQQQDDHDDPTSATTATTTSTCSSTSNRMTAERRRRLVELGVKPMSSDPATDRWTEIEKERWAERFELLKEYKDEYGNCE